MLIEVKRIKKGLIGLTWGWKDVPKDSKDVTRGCKDVTRDWKDVTWDW